MNFYERFILKDAQDFQNLTAEEKERNLTLFKHQYLASWLTCLFMNSPIPNFICCAMCIINIMLDGAAFFILFFINIPIGIFILGMDTIIFYNRKKKKQNSQEIANLLIEKFQNLWLLNNKVISFKDWKTIKKTNKEFYYNARSEACNNRCYFTSYALANTLLAEDIKILWICIEPIPHKRCGHSVIARGNNIYDSNLRRTYNREEYLRAFKAEVFKEYSIEEYFSKANLQQTYYEFVNLKWEEFGKWCETKNAVRSS